TRCPALLAQYYRIHNGCDACRDSEENSAQTIQAGSGGVEPPWQPLLHMIPRDPYGGIPAILTGTGDPNIFSISRISNDPQSYISNDEFWDISRRLDDIFVRTSTHPLLTPTLPTGPLDSDEQAPPGTTPGRCPQPCCNPLSPQTFRALALQHTFLRALVDDASLQPLWLEHLVNAEMTEGNVRAAGRKDAEHRDAVIKQAIPFMGPMDRALLADAMARVAAADEAMRQMFGIGRG
ncbi:hypothetical protein C8R46DRAFT_1326113, partial [Mycena filopes]